MLQAKTHPSLSPTLTASPSWSALRPQWGAWTLQLRSPRPPLTPRLESSCPPFPLFWLHLLKAAVFPSGPQANKKTKSHTSLNSLVCYRVNFVSPFKFICWNLIPSGVVFGDGDFGRCNHEFRISALVKNAPSTRWEHSKMAVYAPGSGLSPDLTLLAPWSWSSQPPELRVINFCCLEDAQCMVLCYRSQNGLRHLASSTSALILSYLYGREVIWLRRQEMGQCGHKSRMPPPTRRWKRQKNRLFPSLEHGPADM